ncbi:MAG: hypothetical protein HY259_05020, partial [Chloroflexi bacterium]|nr:hypothetical protein [Chloroflexota bacterium]
LLSAGADASLWSAIAQYRQAAAAKAGVSYEVVWTVTDSKGQPIQVEKRPLTGDTSFTWKAASAPDNYVVSARIAASDGGANSAGADTVAIAVAVPSATLTPTPLPTALPTATARPTSPPATPRPTSPPPAPAVGGFFGFGIQADFLAKDANYAVGQAKALGFGWVKTQIPYGSFYPAPGQYDFSAMDRTVTAAQAQGVRVLFSIVKAPKWSRPPADTDEGPPSDVNTYADFVRAVAARYAAIVVSGAPTPTGWNDGDVAIDDQVYLQQMYANGLKNYSDAIGAHPSGFNCPALADWRNVPLDPNARFKGPINTPHPSFCFLGTMQGYRNIMVANGDAGKRIWATEFGWATVQNMGVSAVAGYEYASDNTEAQQALWITQAFQYGRDSGFTGVMFLWNLNYNTPASDEKSAFSILYSDGRPRPSYNSIVAMPK